MKALAIHGSEDLRWEDRPLPEPAAGEVRLRVRYVGICGSDLHYHFHGKNGEYAVLEPLTPGHELSAVVDLDPSGRLTPGTAVTVHPARYGASVPGLEDHPHLRPGGDYLGSAATVPHRQGAAAEYLIVEEHMIRVLPEGLPLERAALAEPLAVALHAVSLAGDLTGRRVLVIGAGPIGLLVVAGAVRAGASVVGASDLRPEPLERARALGAGEAYQVELGASERHHRVQGERRGAALRQAGQHADAVSAAGMHDEGAGAHRLGRAEPVGQRGQHVIGDRQQQQLSRCRDLVRR